MENCWEEAPHSSQDCYPHYNLFQSSIFYDTDNFRVSYLLEDCIPSEGSENEERSAEPPDKPPEAPPKPKRVISKLELYRDPDLFRNEDGKSNGKGPIEPPAPPLLQPWGYDWTKQSWVKEGAPVVVIPKTPDMRARQPAGPRVNNSKAESMMHKMGWQGGALGKARDGSVEPLATDPVCAFRAAPGSGGSPGPGGPPGQGGPPGSGGARRPARRDAFRTNVLRNILEFIQDDTETELLFDVSLRQHERRHIMNIVNSVASEAARGSALAPGSAPAAHHALARDIHAHNRYVLQCGQGDHHQLGIFKEAPEDVYLVTPEDFLAKDEADDLDKHVNHVNGVKDDKTNGEIDDDENPFLKSIKKSIRKDDEPKSITNKFETDCVIAKENDVKGVGHKGETPVPAADKVLEFFLEFAETDVYKEMRFLGSFTESQSSAINALLADVPVWSAAAGGCAGAPRAAGAGRGAPAPAPRGTFRLQQGAHGTPEIHKVPASPKV